jgi:parallel beta-helix repeat protein
MLILPDMTVFGVPDNTNDNSVGNSYTTQRSRPADITIAGYTVWAKDSDVPEHIAVGGDPNETRSFHVTGTLIILPGVSIEFAPNTKLYVRGTLRIIGTVERPVNLTSNVNPPSQSDWYGVEFLAGSSGFVNHTNISYSINGVSVFGASNIHIANNTIHYADFGIKPDASAFDNLIENNEIYNCDSGISIYNSRLNIIKNNEIYNTSVTGISLSVNSYDNKIYLNEIRNCSENGISMSGKANNNTIFLNDIHSNLKNGIRCADAPDNIIRDNQIFSNVKNGIILFYGANRNQIKYNSITQNSVSGIAIEGILDCTAIENVVTNNGRGVSCDSSTGVVFENNSIILSNTNDIFLTEMSVLTSINNSFNSSKIVVYDLSELRVYWYMFLETRNEQNILVPAEINITNSSSGVILPDTLMGGKLSWILCQGVIYTSYGADTSMNPYWITANNGSKQLKLGFDMSKSSRTCVVKFVYYPPPVSTLPESFEFEEDNIYTINLSHYFTSSEVLEYTVELLSGENIQYSFNPDTKLLTSTPPENWNGNERLQVSVFANLGGELTRETVIKVTPVNDAPVIQQLIPNQIKTEGIKEWELDLYGYADDPDIIYGDELRWRVSEVNESFIEVKIKNGSNVLEFYPIAKDSFGTDEIIVWIEDLENVTDSQSIWINLTPVNDPPSLIDSAVMPTTGSPATFFNFSVKYFDPDGDEPLFITIRLNDKISYELKETDIDDENVFDGKEYYFSTKLSAGAHFYWFECSDGYGEDIITSKQTGPIVTIPNKGSLRGRVTDDKTNESISDVNVMVLSMENSSSKYSMTTDVNGNYTLANLEPGEYQIYATADGYKDSEIFYRNIIKGIVSILDISLEKPGGGIIDTPITDVWITINRTNTSQYQPIDFTANIIDLDGDIHIILWNFMDDSIPVYGEQVSHTFIDNGTFNVTVQVWDTDGYNVTALLVLNITPVSSSSNGDGTGDGTDGGNGGVTDKDSSDDLFTLFLVIILIVIILVLVLMFIYVQRRAAEREAEARRAADEEQARRDRRHHRKRKFEYVDREKRNVEQVNLIIADMHRHKSEGRRSSDKSQSIGKVKSKTKRSRTVTSNDEFEIDESDDDVDRF